MFDPPFYDIIFFLIPPFLVNYIYLIPPFPPAPPPPRELKNDNSLIEWRFECDRLLSANASVCLSSLLLATSTVLISIIVSFQLAISNIRCACENVAFLSNILKLY